MKNIVEIFLDDVRSLPHGQRLKKIVKDWPHAIDAAARLDRNLPVGANTFSATLVTESLAEGFTSKLQSRFAALRCFSRQFSTDLVKPLAPIECKFVTAGATTQTDATNFEVGNSTETAVKITPHQYTQSFQVSNSDLQSGLRMGDLISVNSKAFGDTVMSAVMAPLTVANFVTNSPLISSAAGFGWSDLINLWAQLKKSDIHNLVLDGEYYARLLNQPDNLQRTGPGTWGEFNWDDVAMNTNWTGAGANVRGIACNPQAIGVLAGLPLGAPASSKVMTERVITLPEIDLSIAMYSWFNAGSRTAWASFDVVLGASLFDETCGVLIKSA